MFAAMLVEGPVVTAAAAFAAALGHFNIYLVLFLSFWGDLISDIVYYFVGYWGRLTVVNRYGAYLGLTKERIEQLEKYTARHAVKSLALTKFLPVVPTFALITVGALRMPFLKFLTVITLVIIPRSLLFGGLGFDFGRFYDTISHMVKNAQLTLLIIVLCALILYYLYRTFSQKVSEELQDPTP